MHESILCPENRIKINQTINKLTAVGPAFYLRRITRNGKLERRHQAQVFRCDCGNVTVTTVYQVLKEDVVSCGCHKRGLIGNRSRTHDMTHTTLYARWHSMKKRCQRTMNPRYRRYGGRGIAVCQEWMDSFMAFREWAMSHGYREDLQIDRIDNDKGYSPDNCRFVTCKANQRNRSSNQLIEAWGETKTIVEWTEDARCHVSANTLQSRVSGRLAKIAFTPEDAISMPPRRGRGRCTPPNSPTPVSGIDRHVDRYVDRIG